MSIMWQGRSAPYINPSSVVATLAMYGWRPINKTIKNDPNVPKTRTAGIKSSLLIATIKHRRMPTTPITEKLG